MQTWQVDQRGGAGSVPLGAVASLLQAAEAPAPGAKLLDFFNAIAAVDYLSLVEYVPRSVEGLATPELVEGHAAAGAANVTPACFALYRERYWRQDEATRIAQRLGAASAPLTALRFRPGDIHVPSWRRDIYERVCLVDRLTFLYSPHDGGGYAVNLYRSDASGPFAAGEIDSLLDAATLLKQAHRTVLHASHARGGRDAAVTRAEATLARRLPELSARERAVCARIACGIGIDGIAADLDVAPSTAITLRKRGYAKLAARGLGSGRATLAKLAE